MESLSIVLSWKNHLGQDCYPTYPCLSYVDNDHSSEYYCRDSKGTKSLYLGDNAEHKRAHAVNWKMIMMPKHNGGTAMCSLFEMNTACIMKLGWEMGRIICGLMC